MSIFVEPENDVVADKPSETLPLAGLPGANRTVLARPPLELAVVEIRFADGAEELPSEAGLRLRERLQDCGLGVSRLEQRQTQRVSIAPGTTPSVDIVARGWSALNADGSIQATVLPEAAVFQTSKYHHWSATMRPAIEAVLRVAEEFASPTLVVRVGLRYVNRLVDDEAVSAESWKGRVRDPFLGPVCHDELGPLVKVCQQQIDLAFSDTQGAIVRHGPFVDDTRGRSVSYLLDIDCFDATPTRFDVEAVADRAQVLNRTAFRVFVDVLTEEYRTGLGELETDEVTE